jgi:hypothetical protein
MASDNQPDYGMNVTPSKFDSESYLSQKLRGFAPADYIRSKYQAAKDYIANDPELSTYADIARTTAPAVKGIANAAIGALQASSPMAYAVGQAGEPKPQGDMLSQITHMPGASMAAGPLVGRMGQVAESVATPHGPSEALRQMAAEYTGKAEAAHNYVHVNPERGERIANAYESMQHAPSDPAVKSAYSALIDETMAQWQHIKKSGLQVEPIKAGAPNPYQASGDAIKDIRDNNHLYFFPTEQGFGSKDLPGNPLLTPTNEYVGNHQMLNNDIFRVVHDVYGHAKEGVGFGPRGEENAYRIHAQMYSPEARKALASETRGQNSWVNYGPLGTENRANPQQTTYAAQKTGLLPDWAVNEGLPQEAKPTDLYHYSPKAGLDVLDPAKQGTSGVPGAEYRNGLPEVPRTYFYEGDKGPEQMVTGNATAKYHVKADSNKIYDLNTDTNGIVAAAIKANNGARNSDMILKAVKDAGFEGFKNSGSTLPTAVGMFGKTTPAGVVDLKRK